MFFLTVVDPCNPNDTTADTASVELIAQLARGVIDAENERKLARLEALGTTIFQH